MADFSADNSGTVVFHSLHFTYPTRPGYRVLQGLTLEVPAGMSIALTGASGCGKSTIVSLLLRQYSPVRVPRGHLPLPMAEGVMSGSVRRLPRADLWALWDSGIGDNQRGRDQHLGFRLFVHPGGWSRGARACHLCGQCGLQRRLWVRSLAPASMYIHG